MERHPSPPCRRGNPLRPEGAPDNMFPDPHIKIFVNPDTGRENMYVYVGHDEGKDRFIMRDWYVLWSEDLVHWQYRKSLAREDMQMTLRIRGEAGGGVSVLVDGSEAGRLDLKTGRQDFAELTIPLQNSAGEHGITLELTGRLAIDWFRLQ